VVRSHRRSIERWQPRRRSPPSASPRGAQGLRKPPASRPFPRAAGISSLRAAHLLRARKARLCDRIRPRAAARLATVFGDVPAATAQTPNAECDVAAGPRRADSCLGGWAIDAGRDAALESAIRAVNDLVLCRGHLWPDSRFAMSFRAIELGGANDTRAIDLPPLLARLCARRPSRTLLPSRSNSTVAPPHFRKPGARVRRRRGGLLVGDAGRTHGQRGRGAATAVLDRPGALVALCPVWSALGGPYSSVDCRQPRPRAPLLLGILA